ncbi:MAG TPA: YciI family protein [Dehalococcoidia bacterium]|nr:YciI family protein [Dehalococcoidia bacterium]
MKFMLLIHQVDAPRPRREGDSNDAAISAFEGLDDGQKNEVYAGYHSINETAGVTPGVQLAPAELATTVRVQDGKTVATDGPFAETKEALNGYLFFEADSLPAAVELASRIPAARMGGAVEVRPVIEQQW